MIKFFRHIRKELMETGKTGKYLKYAIGEIALVVIGILIALQINNWNENSITQKNQEKYLVLLKNEAINNLNAIKISKRGISNTFKGQRKVVELIDSDHDTISEQYLSQVFSEVFFFTNHFRYENNVLLELKTTGELKNISNDSIRNNLMGLEALVSSIKGQEESVEEMYKISTSFNRRYGSIREIFDDMGFNDSLNFPKEKKHISNIPLLKLKEFENNLIGYTGTVYNLLNWQYPKLEKHLNKLIVLIDEELEKDK
jgi:AraC-like DNA-binding protein